MQSKPLLLVTSITVSLILGELILRISGYKNEDAWGGWEEIYSYSMYQPDNKIIYLPSRVFVDLEDNGEPSNYDQTDQFGFRFNPSHQKGDNFESNIVLMIGDSFTYGSGVKHTDTYPAIVENMLNRMGKVWGVHNAGIPGTGPDQQFIYFRDFILPKFTPRILVWNINVNDAWDSNGACLFVENRQRTWVKFKQVSAWRNTLYIKGFVIRNMPEIFRSSRLISLIFSSLPDRTTMGCTIEDEDASPYLFQRFYDKLAFLMQETKTLARFKNFKFIVVIVPFQIYFDGSMRVFSSSVYFDSYYTILNVLEDTGVDFVDTNKFIVQQKLENGSSDMTGNNRYNQVLGIGKENLTETLFQDESNKYEYGNWHLNRGGNQILAESVSGFLTNKIIPKDDQQF